MSTRDAILLLLFVLAALAWVSAHTRDPFE
jgi:hypothetical protein